MLIAVLIASAALAVGAFAVDRLLAALVGRRIGARIGALAGSDPEVRIAGVPFVTQMLAGVYHDIRIELPALSAGGVEFGELVATLTGVRAPLGGLRAGDGLVAGQITVSATMPMAAIGRRLPSGLALRGQNGRLRVSGTVMLMPVWGTLGVRVDHRRIWFTPEIAGIPALVGFFIDLPGFLDGLSVDSVVVTSTGLEITVRGKNIGLGVSGTSAEGKGAG